MLAMLWRPALTLRNKVVSALRWAAIFNIIGQVYGWAASIYVIRLLVPEDYALMAIALVFTGFAIMLREAGMGDSIIQKQGASEPLLRQIFGLIILLNISFYLLFWVSAPTISRFFEEPRLVEVIRVLSLQLFVGMFAALPQALLRKDLNFKRLSQAKMVGQLCGGTLTLVLAYLGYGVWSLVFGIMLVEVIQTIALNIANPVRVKPSFRFQGIKDTISFGGYVTATRILWFIYSRCDVFIVGKLLGSTTLGFFSVARNLAMMPMSKVGSVINPIAFSAFAALQHDKVALRDSFIKAVQINALVFFPVVWGLSAVSPDLVPLVLGERWLEAAPLLQIVCLVVPIRSLATMLRPVLNGLGRPEVSLFNVTTDTLIIISALFIGTYWGALGVCWAWVLGGTLSYLINLIRSLSILGLDLRSYAASLWPTVVSALAIYAAILMLQRVMAADGQLLRLMLSIIVGVLVYGGLTLLINRPVFMRTLRMLKRN